MCSVPDIVTPGLYLVGAFFIAEAAFRHADFTLHANGKVKIKIFWQHLVGPMFLQINFFFNALIYILTPNVINTPSIPLTDILDLLGILTASVALTMFFTLLAAFLTFRMHILKKALQEKGQWPTPHKILATVVLALMVAVGLAATALPAGKEATNIAVALASLVVCALAATLFKQYLGNPEKFSSRSVKVFHLLALIIPFLYGAAFQIADFAKSLTAKSAPTADPVHHTNNLSTAMIDTNCTGTLEVLPVLFIIHLILLDILICLYYALRK